MVKGRVCTGFSKPYIAEYTTTLTGFEFKNPEILARGVSVKITPNSASNSDFYADNQKAESGGSKFTGGSLALTVDGLKSTAEQKIMGTPATDPEGWLTYDDDQEAPYLAFGCIARYMSEGVESFVPVVIVKTKFDQTSLEAETQGENITFQSQSLNAVIFRGDDSKHTWKYMGKEYATEELADAALVTKLGGTK